MVYPDMLDEEQSGSGGKMSYPRPISEPPSPSSSRATTPCPSDDEVDSEGEVIKFPKFKSVLIWQILLVGRAEGKRGTKWKLRRAIAYALFSISFKLVPILKSLPSQKKIN